MPNSRTASEGTAPDLAILFQPGNIGKLGLRNRVIKSPQATGLANPDGTVSLRLINHYRRLAEGGVGLIIIEYSYIDDVASKSLHAQVGISRPEHISGLGWLVDEVHAAGAKVGIQLVHCGRQRSFGYPPIKSASDVSWDYVEAQYGARPQPMEIDEIKALVRAFGDAAQRAYLAQFDLIEIHAAHGYLLTNFLSPHTNLRTDEYGGSFENRSRLLLEVIAEIRSKIPRDIPLSVRLSVTDYEPDGIPVEETVELSRLLAVADVDVIHASGGHHARMEYEVSPWFMPRAVHRHGWEYIKRASSIPVIASGSIVEPILAAEILRAKTADFVSLGRPMLADPDWAKKAQEGRLLDIVPCIRCNDGCLHRGARSGRSAGCTVNPHMGEEYRYSVKRVSSPKRIAVAGGGPAGLRAAAVLADRGHNVTLFEPNALGGLLVHATRTPIKRDLARLLDHLVYQVSCRDVEVLAEMATADGLCERGYDAAVIATGTKPRPLAASLTNDAPVIQAVKLEKIDDIGPPVIIVGGGLTGCNIALWFAESGIKDVTILEAEEHLLAHNEVFTDSAGLPNILKKAGITICTDAHVTGVASDVVYAASKDGAERIFPARRVIVACGYEPNHQLADELVHRKSEIETFVIGTARSGSRVMDALRDAFFVARLT